MLVSRKDARNNSRGVISCKTPEIYKLYKLFVKNGINLCNLFILKLIF